MSVVEVRADDPRVADFSNLADRSLRARGDFIAEGRLVVSRIVQALPEQVRSVLVTPASRDALQEVLATLPTAVPILVVPREAFLPITGFNLHRGCLALVTRPAEPQWQAAVSHSRLVVILEAVTDADNVGGVFRNAAAFGADAVLLSPTSCDPLYRKAIRTSMAATLSVPFARLEPWPEGISRLRELGFSVVALTPDRRAQTLGPFLEQNAIGRLALLFGTEGVGLSRAAIHLADACIRIPTTEQVDSLNLAVAAGIVLSRLRTAE